LRDERPWLEGMRLAKKRHRALDHFKAALSRARKVRRSLLKANPAAEFAPLPRHPMYKEPAVIDRRPKKCFPERKGYAQEKKPAKAQKRRCAEIEDDDQLAASTEGDEKNAESSLETRFALHDEQPWVDAMRVVRKRDRAMDHFRKALRKAKRIRRNLHKTPQTVREAPFAIPARSQLALLASAMAARQIGYGLQFVEGLRSGFASGVRSQEAHVQQCAARVCAMRHIVRDQIDGQSPRSAGVASSTGFGVSLTAPQQSFVTMLLDDFAQLAQIRELADSGEIVSRNAFLSIVICSNGWHSHQAALRAAWWLCQPLEQIMIPRKALCVVCVGGRVLRRECLVRSSHRSVCVCGKLCMLRALGKT
jgi:hypothetical protein